MRVICLRCRNDRRHEARGLCKSCTRYLKAEDQLHLYPPIGPGGRPPKPKSLAVDEVEYPGQWVRRGLVYYAEEVAS